MPEFGQLGSLLRLEKYAVGRPLYVRVETFGDAAPMALH